MKTLNAPNAQAHTAENIFLPRSLLPLHPFFPSVFSRPPFHAQNNNTHKQTHLPIRKHTYTCTHTYAYICMPRHTQLTLTCSCTLAWALSVTHSHSGIQKAKELGEYAVLPPFDTSSFCRYVRLVSVMISSAKGNSAGRCVSWYVCEHVCVCICVCVWACVCLLHWTCLRVLNCSFAFSCTVPACFTASGNVSDHRSRFHW